jgi:serine phosphatase RsbU (regulator of sigma subunit)
MAVLLVRTADEPGLRLPLRGERIVLGRETNCDIVITETLVRRDFPARLPDGVSRRHAVITCEGDKYYIEDGDGRGKPSHNGTYVNDRRLAFPGRVPLRDNDRIRICDFVADFFDGPPAPGAHDIVEALSAGSEDARQRRVELLSALNRPVEDECRRIRQKLEFNHVFYEGAGASELQRELSRPHGRAREILAEGFRRLVVFDADQRIDANEFDLKQFLRHVYQQLVRAFDLHLAADTYHLENIAQILKDEPRSLLCFLNLQGVPIADLRRLRGFAQEAHQALFLCCGARDLASEEQGYGGLESDSEMSGVVQTEQRNRVHEIAAEFVGTLELGRLLPKVGDSLFQLFRQADCCFLILAEDGGERLAPRLVKTRRPGEETTARFSRAIVRRCWVTGQASLSDDARGDGEVESRTRSVMCVPLCAPGGRILGVIQLDTQDHSKRFTQGDLKLLWGVADQAAFALENARLHEEAVVELERVRRDLELASEVQLSFLPRSLPQVPGYEFFAHYESALEVGGDYYDFIPLLGGKLAVALGEAAGRGFPAALLTAKLSSDARFSLLTEPDPGRAVSKLNDLLYEFTSVTDRFVTLAAAVLDPATHTVTLVNAGHPSPLLFRPGAAVLETAVPTKKVGVPLGVVRGYAFEACRAALRPGDCLVLYSDGLPEAVNHDNAAFGPGGIQSAVLDASGPTMARAVGERLVASVRRHAAGRQAPDDLTLVCFGREP